MIGRTELLNEIDRLPTKYLADVFDFVGYLQQKAEKQNSDCIAAYKLMAADTEREQEAREWCNAYFGPVNNQ